MTKTIIKNFLLVLTAILSLTIISCSKDDDPGAGIDPDALVGTWTTGSVSVQSITIDGEPFSDFLDAFRELLIGFGATQAEADEAIAELEAELEEGSTEGFPSAITFNSNGTYEVTVEGEGSDTGTWEFTKNETAILIDKGTDDETEIQIVSLTESRFEGTITMTEEDEELGSEISIILSIVFNK